MSTQPEATPAERLKAFLEKTEGAHVHSVPEQLLDAGGFIDRFNYFMPFAGASMRRSILVSGSAVGTELLVARDFGFERACGTEVEEDLAAIAASRLEHVPGCNTTLYDGVRLPFPDRSFDVIASGHIIEHTSHPDAYMAEHLRVLRPAGILFLEFPDRNHPIELHRNAPGFEWMPGLIRELTYAYLSSAGRKILPEHVAAYRRVAETLNAIGLREACALAAKSPYTATLRHAYKPLPGFVRCIFVRQEDQPGSFPILPGDPVHERTFFERMEEGVLWPKGPRRDQSVYLLDPARVADTADWLSQTLVFILWCVGRFFAAGRQVTEDLDQQIQERLPGAGVRQACDVGTEDYFIPGLFSSLLNLFPELDGPYWQATVVAAFQTKRLRRALDRYYQSWLSKDGGEFLSSGNFAGWYGAD